MAGLKMDLVVIGAGGGGLSAAAAAAEKGLNNILVLENRAAPGGNAVFVGGIFAAESPLQKKLGINAPKDLLFQKAMTYGHWRGDPRLIRALVDKSDDTIAWLEEKGMVFDRILPLYPHQDPLVFHFQKKPGTTGGIFVKTFVRLCRRRNIPIMCGTRAKALQRDEAGRIRAVSAECAGKSLLIDTKSVVIATGGFAGNETILKKYLPHYNPDAFHTPGFTYNGDGFNMASAIGAANAGMAVLEMGGPTIPGSLRLAIMAHQPCTVWVNRLGQRFSDEANPLFPEAANTIFRQPDQQVFVLFDETIKHAIYQNDLNPLDQNLLKNPDWTAKAEKDLEKKVAQGKAIISDDLDKMAAFVGANATVLADTIREYNHACEQKHDTLFAKNPHHLLPLISPPYYGLRGYLELMTTHGGPKINQNMEVLDQNNLPIPGLFAAGVETGIIDADTYDAHLTGHSFGFTVNSGRIAGESAAQFVQGN